MSGFISSTANRFYVALEPQFGIAAAITAANRISAVQLSAHQAPVPVRRRDKTGSRTPLALPNGLRTVTSFGLSTYLTSWNGSEQPAVGALMEAGMGAAPQTTSGLQVASATGLRLETAGVHGLTLGSAISFMGEIRFVASVIDSTTVQLNAPFTGSLPAGAILAPCVTYKLSESLPSVSVYDYWSPSTAISRLVTGAAVNEIHISVNGDIHELTFGGPACDLLDSATFSSGTAGLPAFPSEPTLTTFDYSVVPGHLGQVWLGNTANQFFSLTSAQVLLANNVQLRAEEYGASKPLALLPGPRQVDVEFSVLAQDDSATAALYTAAKWRNPISAMLQLGQQQGRLMGLYVPSVIPEMPLFKDAETRLEWQFRNCMASGVSNDELFIAFA